MKIGVSSDISFFPFVLKASENKTAGGSAFSSTTTGGFVSVDSERCVHLALRSVSRIIRFVLPQRLEPEAGRRNENRSFVGHFLFPFVLKASENKTAGGSAFSSTTTGGFVSVDSERCVHLALRSVSRIIRFLLPRRLEPETSRRNEDRSFVGHFLFLFF